MMQAIFMKEKTNNDQLEAAVIIALLGNTFRVNQIEGCIVI